MRRPISLQEFADQLATFEHTAFRLELQPEYHEPSEAESLARFHSGEPIDPGTDPAFVPWFEQIGRLSSEGKRVERVRVHEEPPTLYQQWERWLGAWNTRAGERIRYMTRSRAGEVGLLPAAGTTDWWLLDSTRLLLMPFDEDGNRLGDELVTDPEVVVQACAWRDLAIHHGILEPLQDAAA